MEEIEKERDDGHADAVLRALGHPMRRRIMRLLLEDADATSPTQAARRLNVRLSQVSYHFRMLAEARALQLTGERPVRGSVQHFYRVDRTVAEMPMVVAVL